VVGFVEELSVLYGVYKVILLTITSQVKSPWSNTMSQYKELTITNIVEVKYYNQT